MVLTTSLQGRTWIDKQGKSPMGETQLRDNAGMPG
jgi:hypothetical protein